MKIFTQVVANADIVNEQCYMTIIRSLEDGVARYRVLLVGETFRRIKNEDLAFPVGKLSEKF